MKVRTGVALVVTLGLAGLAYAASPVGWNTFPKMPSDNDEIAFTEVPNGSSPTKIKFTWSCSKKDCWSKELKIYDGQGRLLGLLHADGASPGPHSIEFERTAIAKIELCKAKAFGVMTGMYELTDLTGKQGKELKFDWRRD